MWCPKCKAEYREGFTMCSRCEVDLVKELPQEPKPEYVEFKEVLTTFNPADIAMIQSLLEGEGVNYYIDGENFLNMRPLAIPARLMVQKDHIEDAKNILKDLKLRWTGISLGKD